MRPSLRAVLRETVIYQSAMAYVECPCRFDELAIDVIERRHRIGIMPMRLHIADDGPHGDTRLLQSVFVHPAIGRVRANMPRDQRVRLGFCLLTNHRSISIA